MGCATLAGPTVVSGQEPGPEAVPSAVPADPAPARQKAPFHASAYLPLGHWAYPMIDYWISTGQARLLSPVVRPYTRMQVASLVAEIESAGPQAFEEEWLRRLRLELAPEMAALETVPGREAEETPGETAQHPEHATPYNLTLFGSLGATATSQTHRDPLRPELEGQFSDATLLEYVFLESYGNLGPVVGGLRFGRDGTFLSDPQFPDGRVVPDQNGLFLNELGMRVQEGYLEVQTRYASLFFGRMYRNWGFGGLHGLTLSDYAYSEEALSYRVGTDRIFLTGSFAPFGDFAADTTRYFSIHRLEVRPWDSFMVALSEAVIHGGPSQPLQFSLLNPLGFWHITGKDQPPKNTVGQVDLWWRPTSGVTTYGSLLLDTTNTPRTSNSCCGIGGSLGVDLAGLLPGWIFKLQGTAIQSLVYRTELPWEEWSIRRIGLGWDKSDLYQASLKAGWFAGFGLRLEPRLDFQVRGEGDFREPRPPNEELPDLPRILIGQTETTWRPAVAGRWRVGSTGWLDLEWDLGINFVSNYAHQAGVNRTEFVGWIRAVFETPRWIIPVGG